MNKTKKSQTRLFPRLEQAFFSLLVLLFVVVNIIIFNAFLANLQMVTKVDALWTYGFALVNCLLLPVLFFIVVIRSLPKISKYTKFCIGAVLAIALLILVALLDTYLLSDSFYAHHLAVYHSSWQYYGFNISVELVAGMLLSVGVFYLLRNFGNFNRRPGKLPPK